MRPPAPACRNDSAPGSSSAATPPTWWCVELKLAVEAAQHLELAGRGANGYELAFRREPCAGALAARQRAEVFGDEQLALSRAQHGLGAANLAGRQHRRRGFGQAEQRWRLARGPRACSVEAERAASQAPERGQMGGSAQTLPQ